MRQEMTGGKGTIARNTMLLYVRMLFMMLVSLYTSRVVLKVLGVEDFGLYNVVGGVVAMFSLVTGSLSSSISRFLTFWLGKGDKEQLRKIFSTAINIQLCLALLILILSEAAGVWFLNTRMTIPEGRLAAANWVFQCSVLTFLVNLVSLPYNALIIAYERMNVFAYISILEASLKLAAVFLLSAAPSDKLVAYAGLLLGVSVVIRLVYGIYCRRNIPECRYVRIYDKALLGSMVKFAGWNTIGVASAVLKDQGVNIVINLFCGPAVNAARAISVQVNTAAGAFVSNFMTALNPQITKSYAAKDFPYMKALIHQGTRFSFYMLLLLSVPILIETETVLSLWLTVVPAHTVLFVRLILVLAMCDSLSGTLITTMLATGNIRNYQIVVGGLQLLNFPLSYLALKAGLPPESTMMIAIALSAASLFVRLLFLRRMAGLPMGHYLKAVVGNVCVVAACSFLLPLLASRCMAPGWGRLLLTCAVASASTSIAVYWIGCSRAERVVIKEKIIDIKRKFL